MFFKREIKQEKELFIELEKLHIALTAKDDKAFYVQYLATMKLQEKLSKERLTLVHMRLCKKYPDFHIMEAYVTRQNMLVVNLKVPTINMRDL